jgi:hypothetical protein
MGQGGCRGSGSEFESGSVGVGVVLEMVVLELVSSFGGLLHQWQWQWRLWVHL